MEPAQTVLEKEIGEQPDTLCRTIDSCASAVEKLCIDIGRRDIPFAMIAARGSSDNAGIYAKYLLSSINGFPVALSTPSLYTFYHTPPKLRNALVIAISQSGQSEDIVEVLRDARAQGALTTVITADPSSPLAKTADHPLILQTGPEKAVAATKTFTASLAVLACLSATLEKNAQRLKAIKELPELASRTLEAARPVAKMRAERYRYMDRCVVISRGFSYAIAMEVALKLKELTYITAEPYSSADFLHGPMAMVEPGFPVILIAPEGTLLGHLEDFGRQLQGKKAEIIAISNAESILSMGHTRLPVAPGSPEWLTPILSVIPGQLLGLNLALAKGLEADSPRGLRKVTVTR